MANLWRIAKNKHNLKNAPWAGAFGIEEVVIGLAVPPLVCWFFRNQPLAVIKEVVREHNDQLKRAMK